MLSPRPTLAFKSDGLTDQMDLKLELDGWQSVEFAAENGVDYIVYQFREKNLHERQAAYEAQGADD